MVALTRWVSSTVGCAELCEAHQSWGELFLEGYASLAYLLVGNKLPTLPGFNVDVLSDDYPR